ncbi:MAG: DMT family transporter [Pseudomonadota bacterium]
MDNLRGIIWMTLAMLTFALADMFIVLSADTVPTGQIVVTFGLFGAPLLAGYAKLQGVKLLSPVLFTRPVIIRNLAEIWGTLAVVTALANLPFALVSAVLQATPLLVTLGAAVFLRESVGWRRWLAIFVGLFGVLLILRPDQAGGEHGILLLLAILAVTGLSARDLSTRFVPKSIPSVQLASYGFFSTIPAGLILMAFTGELVPPTPATTAMLFGAAVFGAIAYFSITTAMRQGDIAVVTPFRYTRLIFAFTIAAIVFGEQPGLSTWFGSAIVIATGLYTLAREARARRTP